MSVCLCVYVPMYVCVCACVRACACMYMCVCVCVRSCVCVCVCLCPASRGQFEGEWGCQGMPSPCRIVIVRLPLDLMVALLGPGDLWGLGDLRGLWGGVIYVVYNHRRTM